MVHRTKIIAAIAVVLALAGGYVGYWFYVAARLDRGIDEWAAFQRQAGLTVEFERSPVGGFPFSFRATFRRPHIAGTVGGRRFDWRGPDVEAEVPPFALTSLAFTAPGHHVLDLGAGPVPIDLAELVVRLGFDSGGLPSSASARFAGMQLTLPDGRSVGIGTGTALLTAPPVPPTSDKDPLLGFDLGADDIRLPQGTALLTADPLGTVKLAGAVKGPMPAAPLGEALAAWRDAGGTIELSSFAISQATLSIAGSATVALDQQLQPIVAADVKARGLGPTIDLLASQHRLHPEDALKMKLFVKGAERDAPGGGKEVATGLTVQGGYLSWGPFKIARVPPVRWPN